MMAATSKTFRLKSSTLPAKSRSRRSAFDKTGIGPVQRHTAHDPGIIAPRMWGCRFGCPRGSNPTNFDLRSNRESAPAMMGIVRKVAQGVNTYAPLVHLSLMPSPPIMKEGQGNLNYFVLPVRAQAAI